MWLSEIASPVSTSDWNNAELCNDNSSTNSCGNFLRSLDSESNVSLSISDDNDGLETSTLTGTSLLLHWFDLMQESVNNSPQQSMSLNAIQVLEPLPFNH
jgi:hypothetical protein